jgi:hypothetical protein
MNLDTERKLKFDRRLHGRREWLSDQELQAELDTLPDVSHKALAPDEDPEPTRRKVGTPLGSAPTTGTPGL